MFRKSIISIFLMFVINLGPVFAQEILSVDPVQNALDILKSTNISVTFDQEINTATINDSTFIVHALQTGLQTGTYYYDTGTNTAEFDPDNGFTVGEIVTTSLTTGIEDTMGNPLTNPYEWSFTIEADSGSGEFATKVDYGAGYGPISVLSSDLDSDGDMDLAVANWGSDNVSVLMNNNSSAVPIPDLSTNYSMRLKSISIDNKLEVRYSLPVKTSVKLSLYDILGAKVKEITEEKPAGFHSVEINMKGRPKGVYFLKIEANGFTKTSKTVLM